MIYRRQPLNRVRFVGRILFSTKSRPAMNEQMNDWRPPFMAYYTELIQSNYFAPTVFHGTPGIFRNVSHAPKLICLRCFFFSRKQPKTVTSVYFSKYHISTTTTAVPKIKLIKTLLQRQATPMKKKKGIDRRESYNYYRHLFFPCLIRVTAL